MIYSNGLQVKKLVQSLPKAWKTKVVILKNGDLHNMTYDELRGNLIAYEQNHINNYSKEERKKVVAFNAVTPGEEKHTDEDNNEGVALINRGVSQILRQRQQRPQGYKNNKFRRNDDCCYHCGKLGHIKQNCPKLRKGSSKKNKSFGVWSDDDETEDDA